MEFTVKFEGVPEKHRDSLEQMLRDDISGYPARMSMTSATVKKEKKDAKSGQRKSSK